MSAPYQSPTTDDRVLWDLHLSAYPLAAALAADELGVFDALAATPADVDAFSHRTGFAHRGVRVLLPMLAAMGLLSVREGVYSVTSAARNFLLSSSDYSWGPVLQVMRQSTPASAAIVAALRRDAKAENEPIEAWEGGDIGVEMAGLMAGYMHCHSLAAAVGMARADLFAGVRRLLDVGGGSGCYSIALAQVRGDLRGTVMDLESMCQLAEGYIARGGVESQVDTLALNMFRDPWPKGYDGMLFSNIFHDWDFETCRKLAAWAFEALEAGGRIFLHEALLDDARDGPLTLAAFSIQMLLTTRGQQFTLGDLADILRQAGFVDVRHASTHAYFSVVSARKP